ncbi:hypothetical protein PHISCL_08987 [Aspergillus sclerotialis]|uniref:Uncharacterized protein n=1 Tax=Aspergillus sclerotialis TaxID=2070753 RepID=A0A3A2ZBK9_9EURO|nr:hypothetical protein PHISCL_08987 [Aspergillus sclerotialis]
MGYTVMGYMMGGSLMNVRAIDLSQETKMDIAKQVGEIVLKMQSVKLPGSGPIGGGSCPRSPFTH